MEKVGGQKIWAYFDDVDEARHASNISVRSGPGHFVGSYFELATKIAELQYRNRDHVLLFRGQHRDHRSSKDNTSLKANLFRGLPASFDDALPTIKQRFEQLEASEGELVEAYAAARLMGLERLRRHRIIRWAILQHYEVCATPLLDVTHSVRVAASFASMENASKEAFLFVLAVPNVSGAITASSEAGLQIVRLSSACPPTASRPHFQEGYLLGEYPEIAGFGQAEEYDPYEMDFGRRLVAKFRFNPAPGKFWSNPAFPPLQRDALYLRPQKDELANIAKSLKR